MREIEGTRWLIGRCVVLCVHVGWFVGWQGMNVSGVVVGESTSAFGDRRVCVEVLSDSCDQHVWHQFDTYV